MSAKNPAVDGYIRKNKAWEAVLSKLRDIALDAGLTEEVKWRTPCYTLDGGHVLIIGAGSDHCVFTFVKGALLKDAQGILVRVGPNTQAARLIRFRGIDEVVAVEATLRDYVQEAMAVEKSGLKFEYKKTSDFPVPEEFSARLQEMPALKSAFESLTPGRQRGYLLYFNGAKLSKTRAARVEKCMPRILEGKGLDD